MPSRRAVLASLSTVALAGCIGELGGDPGTDTPYWEGECEAIRHHWTNPGSDQIEPRTLPDGPPVFDRETVGQFVAEYEEVFLYNSVLGPDTVAAGSIISTVNTESVPGGFVVTLKSWFTEKVRGDSTDDGTATAVHADGPHTWKAYLVTHERLVRAAGGPDVKPDPRQRGETVECWGDETPTSTTTE